MKKILFVLIILLCLTGCSNSTVTTTIESATSEPSDSTQPSPSATRTVSTWIESTDLPEDYTPDIAQSYGDVVGVHGKAYNVQRLDEFISNIDAQVNDHVRITQYTVEGDAIIYDLIWDGQQILLIIDSTRDKFGGDNPPIEEIIVQKIVREEREESIAYVADYDNDKWTIFWYNPA